MDYTSGAPLCKEDKISLARKGLRSQGYHYRAALWGRVRGLAKALLAARADLASVSSIYSLILPLELGLRYTRDLPLIPNISILKMLSIPRVEFGFLRRMWIRSLLGPSCFHQYLDFSLAILKECFTFPVSAPPTDSEDTYKPHLGHPQPTPSCS